MIKNDDMKLMGLRSSKLIKNYTWDEVVEKAIEAYKRILAEEEKTKKSV